MEWTLQDNTSGVYATYAKEFSEDVATRLGVDVSRVHVQSIGATASVSDRALQPNRRSVTNTKQGWYTANQEGNTFVRVAFSIGPPHLANQSIVTAVGAVSILSNMGSIAKLGRAR